ncbi:MAG: hypothetical protein ACK55I_43330, partial [bacterium]
LDTEHWLAPRFEISKSRSKTGCGVRNREIEAENALFKTFRDMRKLVQQDGAYSTRHKGSDRCC